MTGTIKGSDHSFSVNPVSTRRSSFSALAQKTQRCTVETFKNISTYYDPYTQYTPTSTSLSSPSTSSISSAAYSTPKIGIQPQDCGVFISKAIELHKDSYLETLTPSDKHSFESLSAEDQNNQVYQWLTDADRLENNEKPRLELRKCLGSDELYANVALANKNGAQRDALFEMLKEIDFGDSVHMVQAGSATIEVSSNNVDKSTPMKYLQSEGVFEETLSKIGYTPGPFIDAQTNRTVIVSDADGTIWTKPESGKSVEANNLYNSAAKEAILSYLSAGGVLVLNTGNDPARTVRKFLVGLAGIPQNKRQEILSRVIFASGGGGSIGGFVNGKVTEFSDYHEFDPETSESDSKLDMLYLGDDAKLAGNDMPAFIASQGHFICVAPRSSESKAQESGISDRVQYGEVDSTHAIFSAITLQAKTNASAVGTKGRVPLFQDMEALLANTRNIAPAKQIIADTINRLGSRENLNYAIATSVDGKNPAVVIDKSHILANTDKLPPPKEGEPMTYGNLMTRIDTFAKTSQTPVTSTIDASASTTENEATAMIQSFLDQTDIVSQTQQGPITLRILEPGNNDQATPMFIAYQIKQLREEVKARGGNVDNLNIEVLAMGKGGHATTAVFPQIGQMRQVDGQKEFTGTEEAISLGSTLKRALEESGISCSIVDSYSEAQPGSVSIKLEKNSTNTGENVKNALRSYQEHKPNYQWTISAKGQSLRQALTFAHQYQENGEKCYDKLWSMPLPRGEGFIRDSLNDYQAVTEFYAGMAENARLVNYAMKAGPFIPPFTNDPEKFQEVLDTLYENYSLLAGVDLEEAKQTVTIGDIQGFFGARFSTLEQAIPWSKSEETQEAFTQGAMKELTKASNASTIRNALAVLGQFKGTGVEDEALQASIDKLQNYIRGDRSEGLLTLCKEVNSCYQRYMHPR